MFVNFFIVLNCGRFYYYYFFLLYISTTLFDQFVFHLRHTHTLHANWPRLIALKCAARAFIIKHKYIWLFYNLLCYLLTFKIQNLKLRWCILFYLCRPRRFSRFLCLYPKMCSSFFFYQTDSQAIHFDSTTIGWNSCAHFVKFRFENNNTLRVNHSWLGCVYSISACLGRLALSHTHIMITHSSILSFVYGCCCLFSFSQYLLKPGKNTSFCHC